MSNQHVNDEQLLAYADGMLDPDAAREVELHLDVNADARRTVRLYQIARQRLANDDSIEPSAAAVTNARTILTRNSTLQPRRSWLESLERIVARLVYDSRMQPAAVRLAGVRDRIELTFQSDDMEVDLQAIRQAVAVDGQNERWRIMGQVSQGGESLLALAKADDSEPILETASDAQGTFSFEVEPGRYELLIKRGRVAWMACELVIE